MKKKAKTLTLRRESLLSLHDLSTDSVEVRGQGLVAYRISEECTNRLCAVQVPRTLLCA